MARVTIYANANDAQVTSNATTYASARAGTGTLSVSADGSAISGEQLSSGATDWLCTQSYLEFPVTALAGTSPVSVALVMFTASNFTGSSADGLDVCAATFTTPVTTSAWVGGASLPAALSRFEGTLPGVSDAEVRLPNTEAFRAHVAGASGTVQVSLNTLRFRNGTAPTTGDQTGRYVFQSADTAGSTRDPQLVVGVGTAVRAAGAVGTAVSGNVAVPYPAGLQANDVLEVTLGASDNVVGTMPAGWTLKSGTNHGTGLRGETWWKRADGTESGTVTVTRTGGHAAMAYMLAVAGVVTTGDPYDAAPAASSNAAGTSATFPGLTTATNGALVLADVLAAGVHAIGTPTGTDPTFVADGVSSFDPRPGAAGLSVVDKTLSGGTTTPSSITYAYGDAGARAGASVIALTVKSGTATLATPSGWTVYGPYRNLASSPTATLWVLVKAVTAGETGNVTLNWGAALKYGVVEKVVANSAGTPVSVTPTLTQNASASSATLPSITPTAANTFRLAIVGLGAPFAISSLAGFSGIVSASGTGGSSATQVGVSMAHATAYPTSGAATGTASITLTGTSAGAAAVHLLVQPANASAAPISLGVWDDSKTTAGAIASGRTAALSSSALSIATLAALKPAATGGGTPATPVGFARAYLLW